MCSRFQFNNYQTGWTLVGLVAVLVAGCGRDDVKVYRIAKSDNSAPAAPTQPMGTMPPSDMTVPPAADQSGNPQLKWTLPAGWVQKAAVEMRVASFDAPGKNGQLVDVSVVPLQGMGGGDLNNVNRWRGQVGLDTVQEGDLAGLSEDVKVGGSATKLYDLAGTPVGGAAKLRILAVALHLDDMVWFFKATGTDESVGLQKASFISFLNSIQFTAAADATATAPLPADHPALGANLPPMGGGAPDTATAAALPNWTVPAAWQSEPPTQMLLAKFGVTENGAKAEITVSSFGGDMGGLLANVNRWRRQVSLPEVDDSQLLSVTAAFSTIPGSATLVDFPGTDAKTGQPARLVGVILPLNGQTWFYKLMGDSAVVDRQKATFLTFVQSVKY